MTGEDQLRLAEVIQRKVLFGPNMSLTDIIAMAVNSTVAVCEGHATIAGYERIMDDAAVELNRQQPDDGVEVDDRQ